MPRMVALKIKFLNPSTMPGYVYLIIFLDKQAQWHRLFPRDGKVDETMRLASRFL